MADPFGLDDGLPAIDTHDVFGDLFPVKTPAGATLSLQAQEEADWYESMRDQYMAQNKLVNVSDLQDLDRILMLETMIYRWSVSISRGFDHYGAMVDPQQLKGNIKDYSIELRLLKAALGIDRVSRESAKGENVVDYLENLRRRAKEFGYHRNAQYEKAVTYLHELVAKVRIMDQCDEEELRELHLSDAAIVEFVRDVITPDWKELEDSFRETQSIWIQEV